MIRLLSWLLFSLFLQHGKSQLQELRQQARSFVASVKGVGDLHEEYGRDIEKIVAILTKKNVPQSLAGEGWDRLAELVDTFGSRMTCSVSLENSIDYLIDQANKMQMANAHKEPVPNLPKWVRRQETAMLITPRVYNLAILGLGGTVSGEVTADAIVVNSLEELEAAASQNQVQGKIVVFNQPWPTVEEAKPTGSSPYGLSSKYRNNGADWAAKYGAAAALIRSAAPYSQYNPHTGWMKYSGNFTRIPAASITVEDAEMLDRMQSRGDNIRIALKIDSDNDGTCTSNNVMFDLPGYKYPNEVVLLSGHMDSWDVGQGAMDDAGGVIVMLMAVRALQILGLRPKRTIRVMGWTAEEQMWLGAKQYYADHNNEGAGNETFVFMAESDVGAFKPTTTNAEMLTAGSEKQREKMKQILSLMGLFDIPMSVKKGNGATLGDLRYWGANGVPGIFYINRDQFDYYFRFHHTGADTMEVLTREDLDWTAASFAIIAHIIANQEQHF